MKVRSSKMRVFSSELYILRMKFHAGFTYINLHDFARFFGDSRLVLRQTKTKKNINNVIQCLLKLLRQRNYTTVTLGKFIVVFLCNGGNNNRN